MDSTYCHYNLSQRINDGQVNNSPAQREEEEEGAKSQTGAHQGLGRDKIDEGQKSKDDI